MDSEDGLLNSTPKMLILLGIVILVVIVIVVIIILVKRNNKGYCYDNSDCGGLKPFCNTYSGKCQQCTENSNCGNNQGCVDGRCMNMCQSNDDCPTETPCILGYCGETDRCETDDDCGLIAPHCVQGYCSSML